MASIPSQNLTPKQKKEQKKALAKQKEEHRDALTQQVRTIYAVRRLERSLLLRHFCAHITDLVFFNLKQKISDLLDAIAPFKKFSKNGVEIQFEVIPLSKLSKETFTWCFDLLKANMEKYYEKVWGWSDSGKRSEMKESAALYLIAWEINDEKQVPVAFSHFRFDYEDEKDTNVLYMYELHVEEKFRGKGIGARMMQILELLAIKHGMDCLMMTVIKENTRSLDFYSKLKYTVDETSPSNRPVKQILEEGEEDYEIFSKSFKRS